MAQTAHATETVSARPSLFELVAADGLHSALFPAVRHCCSVLVSKYPNWRWLLETHIEEAFLVLNTLVQKHYLCTYGGSLAEHFYGVRREPAAPSTASDPPLPSEVPPPAAEHQPDTPPLSPAAVWRSLVWVCGFPYAKHKLDALYEEVRHDHASGIRPQQRWRLLAERALLRLYPLMHALYYLSVAGFYLHYLLELGGHHSPLTRLAGLRLSAVSEQQLSRLEAHHRRQTALGARAARAARAVLGRGLQLGSFLVQWLEWWRDSDERSSRRIGQADVPPPPARCMPQQVPGDPKKASGSRLCLLCGKQRNSPAALAVSGFVFCHLCVFRYVSEKSRCPVTGYPASTDQIYRLYPPDS